MPAFGLNPVEQQNQGYMADQTPYDPQDNVGPFANLPAAVGRGIETGELQIGNLAAAGLSSDTSELFQDAMRSAQVDPKATGFASNVIGGVARMVPALATTLIPGVGQVSAAALLGGSTGLAKYQEMAPKTDQATAGEMALLEGGTNTAFGLMGGIIPAAVGEGIAARALSGAAINTGMASASEGLNGTILRANGYDKMAEEYKYFDATNLATAAILGAVVGAIHVPAKTIPELKDNVDASVPSTTDAALYSNSARQAEDSAPGIPTDTATRNAHVDTMAQGQVDMLAGNDIDVSKMEENGDFIPKPQDPEIVEALQRALQERGYFPEEELPTHQSTPEDIINNEPIGNTTESGMPEPTLDSELPTVKEVGAEPSASEPIVTEKPAAEGGVEQAPESKLADQILSEKPNIQIPDDEGKVTSASDSMAAADKDIENSNKMSELMQVAANCFMRNS